MKRIILNIIRPLLIVCAMLSVPLSAMAQEEQRINTFKTRNCETAGANNSIR